MTEIQSSFPRLPGGPDPSAPLPTGAIRGIDARTCGYLAGSCALSPKARALLLARHGLDEASFRDVELTWMLRLAASLFGGDLTLRSGYDEGYAQASSEAPARALTLEEYAAVIAAIEAGRPPAGVLAEAQLSLAIWATAQRDWEPRIAADPRLEEELRRLVTQNRSVLEG